MRYIVWLTFLVLACPASSSAQNLGQVTEVELLGGARTLTLDFSTHDYELILFSTVKDGPPGRTYSYTVSGGSGSSKPLAGSWRTPFPSTEQDELDARLRREESALASRLPLGTRLARPARTDMQPPRIGSERTFTFTARRAIKEDQTVVATLVAFTDHALGYLDNALPDSLSAVTPSDVEAHLSQFSKETYGPLLRTFGDPSDIDGDGRLIFLYTHLVDQLGGVAGFFSANSLFPTELGGDGNQADMLYINPTLPPAAYRPLLAHESQHLISFNQHVLKKGGSSEELWLNEALSHIAEDLMGDHVVGGNRRNIETYMASPCDFELTAASRINSGIRGAAYLFVRGLVDEYGRQAITGLLKTPHRGVHNVESVTRRSFETLHKTFVSRLYLAGTLLSEDEQHDYTFPYLTEPITGNRVLPPPDEEFLLTTGPPLHGAVRPSAPAFLRLKGSAADQQVAVSTDFEGRFRALLIPVPRDFQPRLMLPKDFFAGVLLDRTLRAAYVAGSPVRVSGAVSSPSVSRGYFRFVPRDSTNEVVEFPFDITDGRFTRIVTFVESQAGIYGLRLYAGEKGSSLSFQGGFAPVSVSAAGPRLEVLPPNFFPGLRLAEPLPTSFGVGQVVRISGSVTDASITGIGFILAPRDTSLTDVEYYCPVHYRRFERIIVFAPSQAGDHDLYVYSVQDGSTPTFLGGFSPIQVAAIGSERVYLPVDYFAGVTLGATLPTLYAVGEPVQVSGTLPDPVMAVAGLWFIAGEDTIRFMMDVTNRHFSDAITFSAAQTGTYKVDFLTFSDDDFWYHGSYYPLGVTATLPDEIAGDANRDGTIGVRDASLVLRAAADLEALSLKQRANADVDQNNAINAQDAILILRFMAGLVDSLAKPAAISALPDPGEHGIPRLELPADHGMALELSLSLPAGTAGGDVALTVGTRATRVVDLRLRGLGRDVLTAVNTGSAGTARIAFAGVRGQPNPTRLVLHVLLPDSVRTQELSIGLEGHLYNAEALPVAEIHTHQAFPMELPAKYRLLQNSPNPFNPSTTIRYDLPASHHTVLTIYNILGQSVRTLVNDRMMAGRHAAVWDGKDTRGRPVGAGIYVYRLTVGRGRFVSTRRMLLLK